MSAAIEEEQRAPDLCEQVGVAVNSKNLVVDLEHTRAVDKVIALAYASSDIRLKPRPLDKIEAELAPLLWRVKAGDEAMFEGYAAELFALWLFTKGTKHKGPPGLTLSFARAVLREWLHERCAGCRGSGKQEKIGNRWSSPRGLKMLSPTLRPCVACGGSGRRRPRAHERAGALGLSVKEYERQRVDNSFAPAMVWLERISRRLKRPLRLKM